MTCLESNIFRQIFFCASLQDKTDFPERESTASFTESIKSVSDAVMSLGVGVCKSIEMLSHAMQGSVVRLQCITISFIKKQSHHAPQSFEVTYTQPLGPPNQQDPAGNGNFYY